MSKDKRKGWLRESEPGDEVYRETSRHGGRNHLLLTLERITPTGIIVCDNGDRFRPNGALKGKPDGFTFIELVKATPELRKKIRMENIRRQLDKYNWSKASDELVKLVAITINNFTRSNT